MFQPRSLFVPAALVVVAASLIATSVIALADPAAASVAEVVAAPAGAVQMPQPFMDLKVGPVPPPVATDFCLGADADEILYVPMNWSGDILTSGSGFYGYRLCNFWLQDVKMAPYSACPSNLCQTLHPNMAAFDLPSSGKANVFAALPQNADDCGRYEIWTRTYKRLATAADFTLISMSDYKTTWNGFSCSLSAIPVLAQGTPPDVKQAATGWDTYRFAVSVKLRTSFQEAAVKLQAIAF